MQMELYGPPKASVGLELHSLEPLLRGGLVRAAEYTPLSGHVNPRSCVRCDPHTFALSLSRVLTD